MKENESTNGMMVVNNGPSITQFSPQLEERIYKLIGNELRTQFSDVSSIWRGTDPRRNLNDECGYPDRIDIWRYWDLYGRNPIATRVVQVLPKETWQVLPKVYEDDRPDVITPFEKAWKELGQNLIRVGGVLSGAPSISQGVGGSFDTQAHSFYVPLHGSIVWEILKRLDVVSGIGRFGVLLMGLDDGLQLEYPASYRPGQKLTFLRAFPEHLALIGQMDQDPLSPRYLQPNYYYISMAEPIYDRATTGTIGHVLARTRRVHWSRIIHVADGILSSDVYGTPRMQEPFNRLLDLDKLYGGSAEMYWKGAFPGYSVETHPQMAGDPDVDLAGVRKMVEQYMNGLQRYMALTGMHVRSLSPQVVDPTPQIVSQLQAICIILGIPMRIFMGSERGELASSQDDANWNQRVRTRARDHVTPRIIVPFVDRMIQLGCLPEPKQYHIIWPDLTSQSGQEKAQIAFQRTQALVQYVKGEGWRIIPPMDYLVRVLGFEEVEATAILRNAKDQGLFDLTKVQSSGQQQDYTHLGTERGNPAPPVVA